jgi:hypothetical protein
MRRYPYFIMFSLIIALGCCDKPDKCNNSCGDRAVCDDNGICQPKTSGDFYNPKTGKYKQIFNIGYETFTNCMFYNFSYVDTPWILPSMMTIDSKNRFNGVQLWTMTIDSSRDIYENYNVSHYDLTFKRDINNKVTDLNIVYLGLGGYPSYNDVFFDYHFERKYLRKTMVSSWVGKVSTDRKQIDFKIYFYLPRTNLLFEDTDTIKIINRSYIVHPECKSDCRFCFECE